MIATLLLTLWAGAAEASTEAAVMVVISPTGAGSSVSSALFLNAAAAELEPRARLQLRSGEQAGLNPEQLETCPAATRYACWVRTVPESQRWLAMVFVSQSKNQELGMATVWLDLSAARQQLAALADRSDQLERALFEMAIETPRVVLPRPGEAELRKIFAALFDGVLRGPLTATGHWAPSGRVAVESGEAGLPVLIDGVERGRTVEGVVDLRGIEVGPHQLSVPGRNEVAIEVAQAQAFRFVVAPPPLVVHPGRAIGEWSGLALVGVGVVVLAVGLTQGAGSEAGCLVAAGVDSSPCPGSLPVGVGGGAGTLPTGDLSRLTHGPGWLALGLGIAAAGGGLGFGSRLLGPPEDPPWWAIALGLAGGLIAYGVVTIAAGD